jgi:carboxylesterase type B
MSMLGDEDCLFLNVYSPTTGTDKQLPVLVWIHGGGYGAGNAAQDMSEIINANQNAFVAVAIQYRVCCPLVVIYMAQTLTAEQLGAFGFLASDEVEKDGVLNAGILDMEFALQWVQKNVEKFGGDATQVTITGESAGAGGVGLLAIARDGKLGTSLFRNVSLKDTLCYAVLIKS